MTPPRSRGGRREAPGGAATPSQTPPHSWGGRREAPGGGVTPSQTVGPFFGFAMPFDGDAQAAEQGIRIEGQVFDGAGEPVPDALLEVFDGDQFARCRTDTEGAFAFTVAKTHHLEVFVFARGLLRHLATRMYFPDESDQLLQEVDPERRHTLVATASEGGLRFDIRLQGENETVFFRI